MWWYTYNLWLYGLNPIIWRLICVLLEIAFVLVLVKIFQENKTSERGWTENYFKIGLSFYSFSIFPIVAIILYANAIAFPVLLGLLGFLFYFRSKKDPNQLYISIFFFSLCALAEYFAAIWILGILLVILFQKQFKRFILLGIEIVLIFCLVSLPLLINDAIGFMQRIIWQFDFFILNWDGTIWAIDNAILKFIPALIAVCIGITYVYKNYNRKISIDFFIVIVTIFLFFSPVFTPWHYLWIFPLISLNIIYSFRKYLIASLFFISYFFIYILHFALIYLLSPTIPFISDFLIGFLQIVGQTLAHMGFLYLIYSYTKSKQLTIGMLGIYVLFYIVHIIFFL